MNSENEKIIDMRLIEYSEEAKKAWEDFLKEVEKQNKRLTKEYYQEIIEGNREPKNEYEKMIAMAPSRPDIVLAIIGMDHAASKIVFRELARKVLAEINNDKFFLHPFYWDLRKNCE